MRIVIHGELPDLNSYIAAERRNKFMAAQVKKRATESVAWQVKGKVISSPAHYHFHWIVKNKRKDPDNIAYACKYVFDGLVSAGVLRDDTYYWVVSIHHTFSIGDPAVEITVDYE